MMRRIRRDEGPYDRENFGNGGFSSRNPEGDARLLRSEPPRKVSFRTKVGVLFGGVLTNFGWVFFTIGFIATMIVAKASNLHRMFSGDGDWVPSSGTVVDIKRTNTTINDETVYEFLISYINQSQEYKASCYGFLYDGPDVMQKADIEYKEHNPSRARIVGTREAMVPAWVVFIPSIFILIGGTLIAFSIFKNRRGIRLLREGIFIRGKLIGSQPTNVRVNNRQVMAYEFSFTDEHGHAHIATCKTHQPYKIQDEGLEIILYDKHNPEHSIVYDGTPGVPRITPEGTYANGSVASLLYLLYPIIAFGVGFLILFS